jgi:hypothetical protein
MGLHFQGVTSCGSQLKLKLQRLRLLLSIKVSPKGQINYRITRLFTLGKYYRLKM